MKYEPPTNTMRKVFTDIMGRLNALLKRFNRYDTEMSSVVSEGTKASRAKVLRQALNDLFCLGYHLHKIENFAERHVRALARHWEKSSLSASTIQWRFSCLRALANWLDKPGLVRDPENYLDNPELAKRKYALKPGESKTWSSKNVDIPAKILEIAADNLNVGLQLLASWAFAVRPQEAWTIRPNLADRGHTLMVGWGTKGGRERVITIDTEEQRIVLDLLKQYANPSTGSLIPVRYKLNSWRTQFYRVCNRHGVSREEGIVPHGLRHEAAKDLFLRLCGEIRSRIPIPKEVVGGKANPEAQLRRVVAEYLGHSRPQIVSCYIASAAPRRKKRMQETDGETQR